MSDAWDKVASRTGIKEGQKAEAVSTENDGFASLSQDIVQEYFGDDLLFTCYEFYSEYKSKPANWMELFEFMRITKCKNMIRDLEMKLAQAKQGK